MVSLLARSFTIYRNNNRNIQLSGKYNVLRSDGADGLGLDAYVSIEGMNNFRQDYSPVFGMARVKARC
ncbi:MAG: hypothetical protein Ct9H300mP25_06060 [Acidobacteriota bacterium]|nr:MAG: hypothetical protein Ct9H300mP25_06060 [Acidobacteriota bacterium]